MQKLCCVCTRQQFSASLDYFVTSLPPYLHQFSSISGGNCITQKTISYFKNTLELKKHLLELHLPMNARLFTADAVSMYTNIPTHTALNLIGKYLAQYQRKNNNEYPQDAVRAGLCLIMTMNLFTFGDLTLK